MTIYASYKRCLRTVIRGESAVCTIYSPLLYLIQAFCGSACRPFTARNVFAWSLSALVKLRLVVDITSTNVCDRNGAILICDCADMKYVSLEQDDEMVPDEQ